MSIAFTALPSKDGLFILGLAASTKRVEPNSTEWEALLKEPYISPEDGRKLTGCCQSKAKTIDAFVKTAIKNYVEREETRKLVNAAGGMAEYMARCIEDARKEGDKETRVFIKICGLSGLYSGIPLLFGGSVLSAGIISIATLTIGMLLMEHEAYKKQTAIRDRIHSLITIFYETAQSLSDPNFKLIRILEAKDDEKADNVIQTAAGPMRYRLLHKQE